MNKGFWYLVDEINLEQQIGFIPWEAWNLVKMRKLYRYVYMGTALSPIQDPIKLTLFEDIMEELMKIVGYHQMSG